ncbi:hypothetical protein OPQ81_000331 [Rhizoctonia solani]|nr:hypothetical protein OPQ81_000331 [Rhizoctonia solani]
MKDDQSKAVDLADAASLSANEDGPLSFTSKQVTQASPKVIKGCKSGEIDSLADKMHQVNINDANDSKNHEGDVKHEQTMSVPATKPSTKQEDLAAFKNARISGGEVKEELVDDKAVPFKNKSRIEGKCQTTSDDSKATGGDDEDKLMVESDPLVSNLDEDDSTTDVRNKAIFRDTNSNPLQTDDRAGVTTPTPNSQQILLPSPVDQPDQNQDTPPRRALEATANVAQLECDSIGINMNQKDSEHSTVEEVISKEDPNASDAKPENEEIIRSLRAQGPENASPQTADGTPEPGSPRSPNDGLTPNVGNEAFLPGDTPNPPDDTNSNQSNRERSQEPSTPLANKPNPNQDPGASKPGTPGEYESSPPTPISKGLGNGCYAFYTSRGLCFLDNYRNLYSDDGTLLHDGSFIFNSSDPELPSFWIDDIPYWIEEGLLMSQDIDGTFYPIPFWTYSKYNKQYFHACGQLYYFDDCRNLYSYDGTLVYEGSYDPLVTELQTPNFYIHGTAYWFTPDGLYSRDDNGEFYRVHTWANKPDSFEPSLSLEKGITQIDAGVVQSSLDLGTYSDSQPAPTPITVSDEICNITKSKAEPGSLEAHSNPLQQKGLFGELLLLSPGSSATESPQVIPITRTSQGPDPPSLFQVSEGGNIQNSLITLEELGAQYQKAPAATQVVNKRRNKDHLRCPICVKIDPESAKAKKLWRRPCALEEHINAHIGRKPYVCPFKECKHAFATKSNMKRHFSTHRAGELEAHEGGVINESVVVHQPERVKLRKAAGMPTISHNPYKYNARQTFQSHIVV